MPIDRSVDDPVALFEQLVEDDRSDGLPVIPATDERVEETLAHTPREPDEVLTEIPANFTELTVETLAEVSVMAGCRPGYFPVVVAAYEALAEWDNLKAVTSTTGGFWIAGIVNGPITDDLDINCGAGLFGPGYRANATIGRAISLALLQEGGVYPETGTMATHGHQGRYTYLFGEKGDSTPWEPLHADVGGCSPDEDAITMVSAHAPHIVSEGSETDPVPTAEDVLKAFARGGAHPGAAAAAEPGEVVFVMSEDHAGQLSREYDKREVKEYLYEHCALPYSETQLMRSPDDAIVVVAGGISNISSVIHTFTFAGNEAVTASIDRV